jgi:membrane-bound lytic murein transglycosylase A
MKKTILILVVSFIATFFGCKTAPPEKAKTPYDRPLPPGQFALRKITNPNEIPDFSMACLDLDGLQTAIGHSMNYLQKPSSRQYYPIGEITHSMALESLKAFSEMLDSGMAGAQLNQAIRQRFDVYISIGCYSADVCLMDRSAPTPRGLLSRIHECSGAKSSSG